MDDQLNNIPFLRDRLLISYDKRIFIDKSPRRSGKTYHLYKCMEYLASTTNTNIRIVSKSYRMYNGIMRRYRDRIIQPSDIVNIPNTMYFIDEFDYVVSNMVDMDRILWNTQSHFYIAGTPSHNGSLLEHLCECIRYSNDHGLYSDDYNRNDHLEVEYIRRNPDGTIEPWNAPASYSIGIVEEPNITKNNETTLFIEDDEEKSYLFRIGAE